MYCHFNKKYEEAIKEFLCNCIQILSIICSQSKEEQSNIFEILIEAYFSGLQEIENQISNQRNEDDPMVLLLLNAIEKARHYALESDNSQTIVMPCRLLRTLLFLYRLEAKAHDAGAKGTS